MTSYLKTTCGWNLLSGLPPTAVPVPGVPREVSRPISWILANHTKWMGSCRTMFRLVDENNINLVDI